MPFADEEGFDVAKDFLHLFRYGEYATVFGTYDVQTCSWFQGVSSYLYCVNHPCFSRLIEQIHYCDIHGRWWLF